MPFYFRKSVKAGPFRFNFSKGGVGVSVGVRGLRIGTGPRGHYVSAGAGGFYYRTSIGNAGKQRDIQTPRESKPAGIPFENSGVEMIEVDSGDVMLIRDENFGELLDEINAKTRQLRLATVFALIAGGLGFLAMLVMGPQGALAILLALPAWGIGEWLDSYRRSSVLYYDISGNFETAYKRMTDGFDALSGCSGKWHIEAGGAVQDLTTWKRNARASHLVKRKTTTLAYALPRVIKSNVTPPSLHVGKQVIYFMPDVALITHGNKIGAVAYKDLRIRWQDSRFIEDGAVPRDAKVVDHTWQHPNKGGGPDRRFKNNRQLPICLYETMQLQSDSGLNELLEFSQTGHVANFVEGCQSLAHVKGETVLPPKQLVLADMRRQLAPNHPAPKRSYAGYWALLIFVSIPTIALLMDHNNGTSRSGATVSSDASIAPAPPAQTNIGAAPAKAVAIAVTTSPPPAMPTQMSTKEAPIAPVQEPLPVNPSSVVASPPEADAFENLVSTISTPMTEIPASVLPAPPTPKFGYVRLPLQLREGPSPAYVVVATIPQNLQVAIIGQENGWTRVSAGPEAMGWLPKDMIGKTPINLQMPKPQAKTTTPPVRREGGR